MVNYYFDGRGVGRWTGSGSGLLGLRGRVERSDLTAVLQGRHPEHGRYLPEVRPARRRAGWDLIFAAPKSLSLLAAVLSERGGSIVEAHRRAVDEAIGHLERRHLTIRRSGAPDGRVPALGCVAAAFDHRTSAAAEPHLHSHLILANLGQLPGGTWGAISSGWWVSRHSLAAIYQLGLRHHLDSAGWRLDWRLRPDGLPDLAAVPRAAVRATSTQRKATVALGWFEGRRRATPQPWRARAADAGFDPEGAPRPGDPRSAVAALEAPELSSAVAARLASTRSGFRESDVIVALAACHPGGASGAEAEAWAAGFCSRSIAIDERQQGATRVWTTSLALGVDERVIGHSRRQVSPARPARARCDGLQEVLRVVGSHHRLSPESAESLQRILTGERTIEVIGCLPRKSGLLATAALLDACRTAWEATGWRAAVSARRPGDAERWWALTGLAAYRPGDRSDVVVVDQADRRSSPELLALVSAIADRGARAILVEGGTLPRLVDPRSRAVSALGETLGKLAPGPMPPWHHHAPTGTSGRSTEGPGRAEDPDWGETSATARRIGAVTGTEAASALLQFWADAYHAAARAPLLVGLGVDEAAGLNWSARTLLVRRGDISGPSCEARGRTFQTGDRIVLYGRSVAGSAGPGGTTGNVVGVDPHRGRVLVAWDRGGPAAVLDRTGLAHAGYAYAATPGMAGRMIHHRNSPVLLLGSTDSVPLLQRRVLASARAVAGLEPGRGRRLAAQSHLERQTRVPDLGL